MVFRVGVAPYPLSLLRHGRDVFSRRLRRALPHQQAQYHGHPAGPGDGAPADLAPVPTPRPAYPRRGRGDVGLVSRGRVLGGRLGAVADDRRGLERLLRYCARPVFAQKRLTWAGEHHDRLVYLLSKPMPDGRAILYLIII